MIFKKVIVKTNSDGADIVSSILLDNGCNGTTIVDKSDVIIVAKDDKTATELTKYYPQNVLVVGVIEVKDANSAIEQITKELGYDAGFGAGTYADDVASFAVTEMVKRQGK